MVSIHSAFLALLVAFASSCCTVGVEVQDLHPVVDCRCWAAQGRCKTESHFMNASCVASCEREALLEISDVTMQAKKQAETRVADLEIELRAKTDLVEDQRQRLHELETKVRETQTKFERLMQVHTLQRGVAEVFHLPASCPDPEKAAMESKVVAELRVRVDLAERQLEQARMNLKTSETVSKARIVQLEEELLNMSRSSERAQDQVTEVRAQLIHQSTIDKDQTLRLEACEEQAERTQNQADEMNQALERSIIRGSRAEKLLNITRNRARERESVLKVLLNNRAVAEKVTQQRFQIVDHLRETQSRAVEAPEALGVPRCRASEWQDTQDVTHDDDQSRVAELEEELNERIAFEQTLKGRLEAVEANVREAQGRAGVAFRQLELQLREQELRVQISEAKAKQAQAYSEEMQTTYAAAVGHALKLEEELNATHQNANKRVAVLEMQLNEEQVSVIDLRQRLLSAEVQVKNLKILAEEAQNAFEMSKSRVKELDQRLHILREGTQSSQREIENVTRVTAQIQALPTTVEVKGGHLKQAKVWAMQPLRRGDDARARWHWQNVSHTVGPHQDFKSFCVHVFGLGNMESPVSLTMADLGARPLLPLREKIDQGGEVAETATRGFSWRNQRCERREDLTASEEGESEDSALEPTLLTTKPIGKNEALCSNRVGACLANVSSTFLAWYALVAELRVPSQILRCTVEWLKNCVALIFLLLICLSLALCCRLKLVVPPAKNLGVAPPVCMRSTLDLLSSESTSGESAYSSVEEDKADMVKSKSDGEAGSVGTAICGSVAQFFIGDERDEDDTEDGEGEPQSLSPADTVSMAESSEERGNYLRSRGFSWQVAAQTKPVLPLELTSVPSSVAGLAGLGRSSWVPPQVGALGSDAGNARIEARLDRIEGKLSLLGADLNDKLELLWVQKANSTQGEGGTPFGTPRGKLCALGRKLPQWPPPVSKSLSSIA